MPTPHRPAAPVRPARPNRVTVALPPRHPLAAALAAALPLLFGMAPAGAGPARAALPAVTPPPPATVPVPAASWRVNGTGAAAPVNRPNAGGGVDQTITQTSRRAIYQWNSFDIGAASSVTFDMSVRGGAALNRVLGSTAPSRIFGRLSATNAGEIYLINGNGILFGESARVDVGGLIASTLNLTDTEFLSGLSNAITGNQAAFRFDGTPEEWVDNKSFVRVDEGAQIVTASGGRVFLFAKRVENAGRIEAPDGQVVLGAGGEVWLNLPTNESALYGSEANPEIPATRGLLVEMGNGPSGPQGGGGTVDNQATGHIVTPRGNTTLVGLAVNHSGRISATTSVSANGSVFLKAQGGTVTVGGEANALTKRASEGGTLTLGEGALIEITPDTSEEAAGRPAATSDDNTTFVTSRIDMAGLTIDMGRNARIVAPGAAVTMRAQAAPVYDLGLPFTGGVDAARIVMREGATIDVSGTTDTTLGVDRHFVTTELLGSNDLRDAPLQKDGLLARSQVTLDTRGSSPILGDLSSYRRGLQRTVGERLSVGGRVQMVAQGGVVMADTAAIDVSGGQVNYTAATVAPTLLQDATGALYDMNTAPRDGVYERAYNYSNSSQTTFDRWGVNVNYGNVLPGRQEAGYVDGRDAGSVQIVAPTVVLSQRLSGGTVVGERQRQGIDAVARGGRLEVGQGTGFGTSGFDGAVLDTAQVSATAPDAAAIAAITRDPFNAALPAVSWVPLQALTDGGFTSLTVTAQNTATLTGEEEIDLPVQATLAVQAVNGDATLDASVRGAAANVSARSVSGTARLTEGRQVDVSGQWLNERLDGPLDRRAVTGGSVTLSGAGVDLAAGSGIDVSGGARIDANGALVGGNAGSIVLSGRETMALDGTLQGYSAATGGSLTIGAPSVRIGTATDPLAPTAALTLAPEVFSQGGFSSYTVTGTTFLDVAPGTVITPRREVLLPASLTDRDVPTGADPAQVLGIGTDPLTLPRTVDLTLSTPGAVVGVSQTGGDLTFGAGARVDAVAQSKVTLSAGRTLFFDGEITAPGGTVTLAAKVGGSDLATPSWLWLGDSSRIDVSGAVLATTDTAGLTTGRVLDGGSVTLDADGARGSSLVMRNGAEIDIRGTAGVLDVSTSNGSAVVTERRTVASNGGSLTVRASRDLYLDGDFRADAGGPEGSGARGGSIDITLTSKTESEPGSGTDPLTGGSYTPPGKLRILRVVDGPTGGAAALSADALGDPVSLTGRASVSAQWLEDSGVADVGLNARDRLVFTESLDLSVDRTLTLNSRMIATRNSADVALHGASVVMGSTAANQLTTDEVLDGRTLPVGTRGGGTLNVQAQDIVLQGRLALQGMDTVTLAAQGDLLMRSDTQNLTVAPVTGAPLSGSLLTRADLTLSATQIYPGTATAYTIDAGDAAVTITRPEGAPTGLTPLSAGGALTIRAATIDSSGTLRAPHGSLTLQATERLTLRDGSVTSVSGNGATVLYGTFTDADTWRPPAQGGSTSTPPLTSAPQKSINLESPTGAVDVQSGATVDLSGGGSVQATLFVPGPGGSNDVFSGADGSFAILPGYDRLAPHDPQLAATAARIGRQIVIGPGAPVPAGTYTLLPARYALLPGGFLVRPQTGGTALRTGAAVRQNDGSVLIGAQLADAGTGFRDALPTTWRVTPRDVGLRSSEIRLADADTFFPDLASRRDLPASRVPADAGALTIAAGSADLSGTVRFQVEDGALGGEVLFSADAIRVVDAGTAGQAGELTLRADQLNQLGAQTVVLGAVAGTGLTDDGAQRLDVRASQVVLSQQDTTLRVGDLVVAARDRVQVDAGTRVEAGAGGAARVADYAVEGDGAALRVAADPGAGFTRTGATRTGGELVVGDGAALRAPDGTLVLDATQRTALGRGTDLAAADLTVTAARIVVGPSGTPDPNALALGPRLLSQFQQADALTLRSYSSIDFADGAVLGSATLDTLTLDASKLRVNVAGAQAEAVAGTLQVQNTTGIAPGGIAPGVGDLTLRATDDAGGAGQLVLAGGSVAVRADTLTLVADQALVLQGEGRLRAGDALQVQTPTVRAVEAGAGQRLQAGGTLHLQSTAGGTLAVQAADGATLALQGESVRIDTRITLPSGRVTVQADGPGGVEFGAGALVDVAGRTRDIGGTPVALDGGAIDITAAQGNISVTAGATLDVSAAGAARGGSLSLQAAQGALALDGTLRGRTAEGAIGASLSLDSAQAVDLAALATGLGRDLADGDRAFGDRLTVRNRTGDQTLAAGTTLSAREITLQADAGALTVAGTLDAAGRASGDDGGRIVLAAGQDMTVADGARLSVAAGGGSTAGGTAGRMELHTAAGTVAVQAGSTLDFTGSGEQGGTLLIRAPRTGLGADPTASGTDVAVDPLAGTFTGVRRVDVEAVKVYEGVDSIVFGEGFGPTQLGIDRIARESSGFTLGGDGQQAGSIAARLAGGNAGLQDAIRVHAGVEVRADGDLAVNTGGAWALPTESLVDGASPNAGDTSVTLRATGDLTAPTSIGAGFGKIFGLFLNVDDPRSRAGGSIRLVAGADLSAAAPTTVRTDGQGDLTIGRPVEFGSLPLTTVATTTGDIVLAAGGDVSIAQGRTAVYSIGRDTTDAAALAAEARLRATAGLPVTTAPFDDPDAAPPSLFRVDGGDVRISAGGDVLGRQGAVEFFAGTDASANDWRATGVAVPTLGDADTSRLVAWWTKLDGLSTNFADFGDFSYGAASFAGGQMDVQAGGAVRNLYAIAASSGYVRGEGPAATVQRFGGGDLRVDAGGDIVNGVYVGTGDRMSLRTGGELRLLDNSQVLDAGWGTRLVHENTEMSVVARGDATLHSVRSAFGIGLTWLSGLDGDASLAVRSLSGSIDYRGSAEPLVNVTATQPAEFLVPANLSMAAPSGALTLRGTAIQQPTDDGRLSLLARDDVTLTGILQVQATRGSDLGPQLAVDDPNNGLFAATEAIALQAFTDSGTRLDRSTRDPVRIASAEGDLVFSNAGTGGFRSARPVDLSAGRDIQWSQATLEVQHQNVRWDAATQAWVPSAEVSVMSAGRDLGTTGNGSLVVAGPGELLLLAGRSIDLGTGRGVQAVGNGRNALLPEGGSNLTLVAGVRGDGADYANAVRLGFGALGGLGLTDRASDLYAQLSGDGTLVPLGSDAARTFSSLPLAARLDQVRTLMGAAAYDAAIAAYVRALPGNAALTDTEAVAAFAKLPEHRREPAVGTLLASRLADQPVALRQAFIAQVAATQTAKPGDPPTRAQQLLDYLASLGQPAATLADAVAAFEALPLNRQLPLLHRGLVQDLRESGRTAVATTGVDADIAYSRGYRAIDLLFPLDGSHGRPVGDIRSASSQVKTLQQGDITLLAPGGPVNAGGVSAIAGKSANELGIVTVAGGDISAVVGTDFLVNQSRVFTLAEGDILLWASQGDIDAGRGAKTVVGSPAPVLRLDANGRLFLDTSGSFTGSGIAVLDSGSALDLYAPQGAIDAGEAGIRASGNAFFGAQVIRGADNLQIGGVAAGAPPAPPAVAGLSALGSNAGDSAARQASEASTSEEEDRRQRRARRQLLLEFLGFGPRG